jgi:hypothetical protein
MLKPISAKDSEPGAEGGSVPPNNQPSLAPNNAMAIDLFSIMNDFQ